MKRIAMKAVRRLGLAAGLLAVALTGFAAGLTEVQAGPKPKTLILFVALDLASFVGPGPGAQGAFNIEGDIFDPEAPGFDPDPNFRTSSPIGTFQCWGWSFEFNFDPRANVSQLDYGDIIPN